VFAAAGFLAVLIMEQRAPESWSKSRTPPRQISRDYFLCLAKRLTQWTIDVGVGRRYRIGAILEIFDRPERYLT
jgi:hypothetical protein